MELSGYLRIIMRRKWVIMVTMISALAVYFLGQIIAPPLYSAEAVLRIVPYSEGETPVTQSAYATRIMNNYVEIARSGPFLNTLRDRLGLPTGHPSNVDVETIPDSELLLISVEDMDPVLAQFAANTIVEMLLDDNPFRDIKITVIDPAVIPEPPSLFTTLINSYLVLMIGMAAGIGVAFLIENFDTRIYDLKEILKIANLPIIGRIPFIGRKRGSKFLVEEFIHDDAFRRLTINFLRIAEGKNLKTIMLTSAQPKEGKSSIAANLAIGLAKCGRKVLLVDADLRLPTIHMLFNMQNDHGLIDAAQGSIFPFEAISKSDYPELDLIFRGVGSSKDGELIEMERVADIIDSLKERYDVVLVDTPAYLVVADSVELVDFVDGVLLVTMQGQVRDYALQNTYQQLINNTTNLIGLVVNNDQSPIQEDYYSYYRQPQLRRVRSKPQESLTSKDVEEVIRSEEEKEIKETRENNEPEVHKDPLIMTPSDENGSSSAKIGKRYQTRISEISVGINRSRRSAKHVEAEERLSTISPRASEASISKPEIVEERTSDSRNSTGFMRIGGSEKYVQPISESHSPNIIFISGSRTFLEDKRLRSYVEILAKAGYQISVISPHRRGLSLREEMENISIYRYPSPDANKGYFRSASNLILAPLISSLVLFWVWRRKGLDVLYIFSPPNTLASTGILPRLIGKCVLLDIHDPIPEQFEVYFRGSKRNFSKGLNMLEKLATRIATHITVSRDMYLQLLLKRVRVPAEKFSVIRLGQDVEAIRFSSNDFNHRSAGETNREEDDFLFHTLNLLKNSYTPPTWS